MTKKNYFLVIFCISQVYFALPRYIGIYLNRLDRLPDCAHTPLCNEVRICFTTLQGALWHAAATEAALPFQVAIVCGCVVWFHVSTT
jgi:hypothetical protein